MENQEEKETSLDYLLKSLDAIMLIPMNNWHTTSDIINKVKSMYEMEIKKAYIQGYKDRAKLSEPENI